MSKIKLTRERSHFGKLEPREGRRPEIGNSVDTGTEVWQGEVRYAHSTTPLSIQQEYPVLISPQHISSVAPSITFYLNYRGKEIGDTSEK